MGEQDRPRLPKGFGENGKSRSVAGRPVVSGDLFKIDEIRLDITVGLAQISLI